MFSLLCCCCYRPLPSGTNKATRTNQSTITSGSSCKHQWMMPRYAITLMFPTQSLLPPWWWCYQEILQTRFPVPRYILTEYGGSQVRCMPLCTGAITTCMPLCTGAITTSFLPSSRRLDFFWIKWTLRRRTTPQLDGEEGSVNLTHPLSHFIIPLSTHRMAPCLYWLMMSVSRYSWITSRSCQSPVVHESAMWWWWSLH